MMAVAFVAMDCNIADKESQCEQLMWKNQIALCKQNLSIKT